MKMLPALLRRIAIFTGFVNPDFDDPKIPRGIIKNALPFKKLQERGPKGEELGYDRNSQVPYTGWVIQSQAGWGIRMQVWMLCHYKDGKKDGLRTSWHENGQKEWETHYKDGKQDGLGPRWDDEDGIIVD